MNPHDYYLNLFNNCGTLGVSWFSHPIVLGRVWRERIEKKGLPWGQLAIESCLWPNSITHPNLPVKLAKIILFLIFFFLSWWIGCSKTLCINIQKETSDGKLILGKLLRKKKKKKCLKIGEH